jgi:hypothetical protein
MAITFLSLKKSKNTFVKLRVCMRYQAMKKSSINDIFLMRSFSSVLGVLPLGWNARCAGDAATS